MGAGHAHALHVHGHSPVHRLAPEVKIAASVLFTVAVVLTPREAFWAFGAYALIVVGVAAVARIRPLWLLSRSMIELPFVVLALALPFAGIGERVDWLGMSLSVDGLYGAWNIFAKGTLGVLSSLLLAGTTNTRDLLAGLDRLRCPQLVTQIAAFMLRYLEVIGAEARRMRIAQLSRGYNPRFLWQLKAYASGLGALFLRAFERGERVYLAMVARGYTGRMPLALGDRAASRREWMAGAVVPALAAGIATLAVVS
jgi:cobalt/nickel transport system permease protein